jgi:hypothetical protein
VARLKLQVLTIHGVNHDETWQINVRSVLEPHFHCLTVKYRDYLGLKGPIKAVINLWLTTIALFSLIIAIVMIFAGQPMYAIIFGGVTAILIVLALVTAYVQRRSCADRLKREIVELTGAHPMAPHVIAHSLGTYLIGRILKKFHDFKLDRIVLIGAVLPRQFSWEEILENKREAFTEIRNEVGQNDWVVKLVGAAKWLLRDLGDSGSKGFLGEAMVHSNTAPSAPCRLCSESPQIARVHNFMLNEYLHSDCFLGPKHARELWLPFLWGYTPEEFQQWMKFCWSATYSLQEELNDVYLAIVHEKLLNQSWSWTSGKDLKTYLSGMIKSQDGASLLGEVVRKLHICVTDAILEIDKTQNRSDNVLEALSPIKAIGRALQEGRAI